MVHIIAEEAKRVKENIRNANNLGNLNLELVKRITSLDENKLPTKHLEPDEIYIMIEFSTIRLNEFDEMEK